MWPNIVFSWNNIYILRFLSEKIYQSEIAFRKLKILQKQCFFEKNITNYICCSCQNFWDEIWWVLSFSVFGLHLYCYIHNVSADMFSGLLRAFLVELRSLHATSNHVLYLIHAVGGSLALILLTKSISIKYSCIVTRLQSGLNLQPPYDCYLY